MENGSMLNMAHYHIRRAEKHQLLKEFDEAIEHRQKAVDCFEQAVRDTTNAMAIESLILQRADQIKSIEFVQKQKLYHDKYVKVQKKFKPVKIILPIIERGNEKEIVERVRELMRLSDFHKNFYVFKDGSTLSVLQTGEPYVIKNETDNFVKLQSNDEIITQLKVIDDELTDLFDKLEDIQRDKTQEHQLLIEQNMDLQKSIDDLKDQLSESKNAEPKIPTTTKQDDQESAIFMRGPPPSPAIQPREDFPPLELPEFNFNI